MADLAFQAAEQETQRAKRAQADANSVAEAAMEEARHAQRVAEASKDDALQARSAADGAWRVADEMKEEADTAKSVAYEARIEAMDNANRLATRVVSYHTNKYLTVAPTVQERTPQQLSSFLRTFGCTERHMQKRRREEFFNLFCAGGKTQISLSDVLWGVMTALTQAHGRQGGHHLSPLLSGRQMGLPRHDADCGEGGSGARRGTRSRTGSSACSSSTGCVRDVV